MERDRKYTNSMPSADDCCDLKKSENGVSGVESYFIQGGGGMPPGKARCEQRPEQSEE